MATITVLGCGATYGVPLPGGHWGLCDPANPKNNRTRPSVLFTQNQCSLLIDIGPDFRFQTARQKIVPDTIVITHGHWDHIAGIGELPYYIEEVLKRDLNIYANDSCMTSIRSMFPYLFRDEELNAHYSIVFFGDRKQYRIIWHRICAYEPFEANGIEVMPFLQNHGHTDSLGLRINKFVYSPDVKSFPETSWRYLSSIDTWVLDCDYWKPSDSHGDPETVLRHVDQFNPRQVFLTHMDEKMDFSALQSWFVERGYTNVAPAYDGLEINLSGTL